MPCTLTHVLCSHSVAPHATLTYEPACFARHTSAVWASRDAGGIVHRPLVHVRAFLFTRPLPGKNFSSSSKEPDLFSPSPSRQAGASVVSPHHRESVDPDCFHQLLLVTVRSIRAEVRTCLSLW